MTEYLLTNAPWTASLLPILATQLALREHDPAFLPVVARDSRRVLRETPALLVGGQRVVPTWPQHKPSRVQYERLAKACPDHRGLTVPTDHYELTTVWHLDAQLERVWQVLSDAQRWPDWWPFLETVEQIEPGEPSGQYSAWRYTWKTMLPYKLRFELRITRIEAPVLLEAEVRGDLVGRGICRINRKDDHTAVCYAWDVRTCRPWMKWLAPVARPVFLWNHRMVMKRGGAHLAL